MSLVFSLFLFYLFFCRLCFILELKTAEGWFFQRFHLSIWVIVVHELGTLSIRVHNSLKVHGNSWDLKFDNFSEFQNVFFFWISKRFIMTLCVRKPICNSPLTIWFGDNNSKCGERLTKNWASNAASTLFAGFPGLLFGLLEAEGVSLSNEDWNGGDGFVGYVDV